MSLLAGAAVAALVATVLATGRPVDRARRPAPPEGASAPPSAAEGRVAALLRETGSSMDPLAVTRGLVAAAATTSLLGAHLVGIIAPLVVLGAVLAVPRLLRPVLTRRRADRRDGQLPAWLERLASALRAGATPSVALTETAETTPWPLGAELTEVARGVHHGGGLAGELQRWQQSASSPAVTLTTSALSLGLRTGGELARSVDRIAGALRDRAEAQAEARALGTQARASAWVLTVAPLGFTALLSGVEPGMVDFLVTTPAGATCLAAGLALDAAGALWMHRTMQRAVA